ncbi:MAG TPA: four helix bundle protein [Bryobacteraceae bacterium]|nr:four helix bundle protein [Bryobacteraceae bacterium]
MGKSFRELDVWHLGVELAETVYRVTSRFPKSEIFALSSQMRRAAVSIPSNIAEGRSRDSRREFLYFLSISRGSLAELETQLELAIRLDYTDSDLHAARAQTEILGKKINRLQTSLRAREPIANRQSRTAAAS